MRYGLRSAPLASAPSAPPLTPLASLASAVAPSLEGRHEVGRRAMLQRVGGLALVAALAQPQAAPAAMPSMPSAFSGSPSAWLPMAEYAASSDFPAPFVVYLSRFLFQYDAASRDWYGSVVRALPRSWPPAQANKELSTQVGTFAASLSSGLAPYSGANGTAALWRSLQTAYGDQPGAVDQLPLLFSLLPPGDQPVDLMRRSLAGRTPLPAVDATLVLRASCDALLPLSTVPVWDASTAGFTLPAAAMGALAEALGGVGRGPLSKEVVMSSATYRGFAISGGCGCALTHLLVVPLDVIKTRLQTRPGVYTGFGDAFVRIKEEEGASMLYWGAGATGAGYFTYGVCVYPLYELFKRLIFEWAGNEMVLAARVPLVLLAGAVATFFTCFAITPFEAVRIRMVECPSYAPSVDRAFGRYIDEGGWAALYDGLLPLLVRQVPLRDGQIPRPTCTCSSYMHMLVLHAHARPTCTCASYMHMRMHMPGPLRDGQIPRLRHRR